MLEVEEKQEKKKRIALIVMIITLVFSITAATFAYFMIAPVSNNSVRGEAAVADMTLNISRIFPSEEAWDSSDKVMAPYETSSLGSVMGSDTPCVSSNGSVACQVYEIVVTNKSTAEIKVDGTITYSGTSTMPNIKWKLYSSDIKLTDSEVATGLTSADIRTITENTAHFLVEDLTMKPVGMDNSSKYYYLVLWIEINSDGQNDHGNYTATVDFVEASNGKGVTSTFTS